MTRLRQMDTNGHEFQSIGFPGFLIRVHSCPFVVGNLPDLDGNTSDGTPLDQHQSRDFRRWKNLVGRQAPVRMDFGSGSRAAEKTPPWGAGPDGRSWHVDDGPDDHDLAGEPLALRGFREWKI